MPDILENPTTSLVRFYREIRDFSLRTQVWQTALRYETRPDERYDMTLTSLRAYGRRDEFIVVLAAAGLDSVEQMLPEQRLVLPTESQLRAIKQRAGYQNLAAYRERAW